MVQVISLCGKDSCCPVVKMADEHVEIGEKDNVCVLTKSEWEALKQKILNGVTRYPLEFRMERG